MTDWEGNRLGEAARWIGAALCIMALHAAVAAWIVRQPEQPGSPRATAIAVELAAHPGGAPQV